MIVILTAGFGDGHNTAAASLSESFQDSSKSSAESVLVVDLFFATLPRLTRAMQSAYQVTIIHCPGVWHWVYRGLSTAWINRQSNWIISALRKNLASLIEKHRPRALVSTFPFYCTLLAPLRTSTSLPPLFTVVTDSISVHPSWTAQPSDYYCVPDAETAKVLTSQGVPPERVLVTGFPVSPAFATPLTASQPPAGPGRILYLPSTPARHVSATLRALRPLLMAGAHLTLAAGKHQRRLYHVITRFADSLPPDRVTLTAWTDQIPTLLRTSDLVICKAGGAILHEALAATTPAIIDYVVPGQEEGNAWLLIKNHCAVRSLSPSQTGMAAAQMLKDNASLARRMRDCMVPPLSVPDAAHITAQTILRLL